MNNDKSHRGNASQFFVAGELCRRGFMAVTTLGNSPNTDILCSNKAGTKFVHIQVKTFRPGDKTCSVGIKSQEHFGNNFFWVLSGIPEPHREVPFSYYIIPSKEMSENINECLQIWLDTPGKKGQAHSPTNLIRTILLPPRKNLNGWDVTSFHNAWSLIEAKLQ